MTPTYRFSLWSLLVLSILMVSKTAYAQYSGEPGDTVQMLMMLLGGFVMLGIIGVLFGLSIFLIRKDRRDLSQRDAVV